MKKENTQDDISSCIFRESLTSSFNGFIGCKIRAPRGMISEDTCIMCGKISPTY